MKGFTKICLLISLICVCIGVVCLGAGIALGSGIREVFAMAGNGDLDIGNLHFGGWNIPYFIKDDLISDDDTQKVNVEKNIVKETFPSDEVEDLEIDIKYGALYLTDSQTDQIEITVDAPKQNTYKCSREDNTVKLLDQTSRHIWRSGLGKSNKVIVTVAIPKGKVFDEIDVATNAGMIEISHSMSASEIHFELDAGELVSGVGITAEEISANVGAGNLEISDFSSKSLEVDCGMGRALLSGIVFKEAEIDCGMGQITLNLQGKEENYDYDISCGLGTVNINEEIYSALSVDKEIDNHADGKIDLECGMGEVTVYIKEE